MKIPPKSIFIYNSTTSLTESSALWTRNLRECAEYSVLSEPLTIRTLLELIFIKSRELDGVLCRG